jgi:hypothetical protein
MQSDSRREPSLCILPRKIRATREEGTPLTIDMLTGTWTSADKTKTLPVYLALAQILTGAQAGHRYRVAGTEDDAAVESSAQAFCRAVEKGDREAVASSVRYPVSFLLGGKRVKAENRQEFLRSYARIFTPKFAAGIRAGVPHSMFASAQGIMLADGAVWFDDKGKIFSLNN